MTNYYALLVKNPLLVGDHVPNEDVDDLPMPVVTDPRTFELADILDQRMLRDDISWILTAPERFLRVARVTPLGEVQPYTDLYPEDTDIAPGIMLEADDGWRVDGFEPTHTILGPQGARIAEVVNTLEIAASAENSDQFARYHEVLEADHYAYEKTADRAVAALNEAGANPYWWDNCAISCETGFETVALGARDLIGTVEGWGREDYDLLATPWRTVFGEPLHPNDTPVTAEVA